MKKQKILFLSHRIPYPPNKGDKLRAFNIIKYLSKSHEIDLISFLDNEGEKQYVGELKKYCTVETLCRSTFRGLFRTFYYLFKKFPLTLGYFYSSRFEKLVREKLAQNKYDLIFVYSSSMAQYVSDYKGCYKILDLVDADSDKWLQYARFAPFWKAVIYKLEGNRLKRYEKNISHNFDICTVVTKQERDILKKTIDPQKLAVIKNGFNLEKVKNISDKLADEPTLLFIGGMFYFAYIDGILYFYENIYPKIKKEIPNIQFYIVGADPAPSIKKLGADPGVHVMGHVPEVDPYLEKAWVYVVPLRVAPGIQNKILEAMAVKIPVVATSAAINGIDAEDKKDVLVADDSDEFANAVISLIRDKDLRKNIGEHGYNVVADKYNWDKNLRELDQIMLRDNDT